MTAIDYKIAGEIRAELARQRITQTDLADRLGVSRQWLQRRFSCETPLTVDDVVNIAHALDVPASTFTAVIDD